MANSYFKFKQFTIHHDRCAMKTTTDACLFGAWTSAELHKIIAGKKGESGFIPKVLDIGAGSGLLSLMIAQNNHVTIDAVEIEPEAVEQAKENIQASDWAEQIKVFHGNILNFEHLEYDYIITNPPFYENEIISSSEEKNVAHHSAALSLADLIQVTRKMLKREGKFFLLYPFKRLAELERSLKSEGLYIQKKVLVKQSVNHLPFRVMIMGSAEKSNFMAQDEINIADGRLEYTPDFIELLQDYYLYL
jgi:tRNA1Val (adenine37-N6)-methyltransferase